MLVAQAVTLNAIFTELGRRAALNMGEYPDATDRYMRLGLRAQSKCRATLETLAEMKNPPVVLARQANTSNGPQQVNNGPAPGAARTTESRPRQTIFREQGRLLNTSGAIRKHFQSFLSRKSLDRHRSQSNRIPCGTKDTQRAESSDNGISGVKGIGSQCCGRPWHV